MYRPWWQVVAEAEGELALDRRHLCGDEGEKGRAFEGTVGKVPNVYDDSVLPVVEAGQAVLVEWDHEFDHGIWLEPAPGHTDGNIVINLESAGEKAVLSGDVVHHPIQLVKPEWSSRACEDPVLLSAPDAPRAAGEARRHRHALLPGPLRLADHRPRRLQGRRLRPHTNCTSTGSGLPRRLKNNPRFRREAPFQPSIPLPPPSRRAPIQSRGRAEQSDGLCGEERDHFGCWGMVPVGRDCELHSGVDANRW